MGFLGVYKALYDYAPQAEGELQISEGDLLYVLEKSEDDDWWKAKKKASDDDDDEPTGLIPSNYIEEVSGLMGNGAHLCGRCSLIRLNHSHHPSATPGLSTITRDKQTKSCLSPKTPG
jgi:hypothetical protein